MALAGVESAVRWFAGENDASLQMYDPTTGGSYDGLHANAVNENQGAESTLAWVSVQQCALLLAGAE